MKSFSWYKFNYENIAVHCETEELAKDFLNECKKHNLNTWANGEKVNPNKTYWNRYKCDTCYSYNGTFQYSNTGFYENNGYKIIEWNKEEKEINNMCNENCKCGGNCEKGVELVEKQVLTPNEHFMEQLKEGLAEIQPLEFNPDNEFVSMLRKGLEIIKEERVPVYFARKSKDVILPSKRDEDGGLDVYAYFEEMYMEIPPHEVKMIPTGLYSCVSDNYVLLGRDRGSTGTKGMRFSAGVIDSGYRGEIMIPIVNETNNTIIIAKKEMFNDTIDYSHVYNGNTVIYPYEKAIGQLLVVPVPKIDVKELTVEELQAIPSERGTGKVGSSGK